MKNFKSDIELLFDKVLKRKKFAFSKYADGEYKILINQPITNCDGWSFKPNNNNKEFKLLLDSFKYQHEDYHVGVSCSCCQPMEHVQWMRNNVGSSNVTWANIFVNIPDNIIDGYTIANLELEQKKIPFIIRRPIPNGACEYWKVSDLELLD